MILALDIATNTGVCWGDGSVPPILESNRLAPSGDDVGAFLAEFEDWLRSVVGRVDPSFIVFEAPVLPRSKYNPRTKKVEGGVSLMTSRKLQGLVGVTEMVAHRLGLPAAEVENAHVKQALTGKGNAKKHEMVKACRSVDLDPKTYTKDGEESSDEADAFGVWLCGLRERAPPFYTDWNRRLHLSRGGLL